MWLLKTLGYSTTVKKNPETDSPWVCYPCVNMYKNMCKSKVSGFCATTTWMMKDVDRTIGELSEIDLGDQGYQKKYMREYKEVIQFGNWNINPPFIDLLDVIGFKGSRLVIHKIVVAGIHSNFGQDLDFIVSIPMARADDVITKTRIDAKYCKNLVKIPINDGRLYVNSNCPYYACRYIDSAIHLSNLPSNKVMKKWIKDYSKEVNEGVHDDSNTDEKLRYIPTCYYFNKNSFWMSILDEICFDLTKRYNIEGCQDKSDFATYSVKEGVGFCTCTPHTLVRVVDEVKKVSTSMNFVCLKQHNKGKRGRDVTSVNSYHKKNKVIDNVEKIGLKRQRYKKPKKISGLNAYKAYRIPTISVIPSNMADLNRGKLYTCTVKFIVEYTVSDKKGIDCKDDCIIVRSGIKSMDGGKKSNTRKLNPNTKKNSTMK